MDNKNLNIKKNTTQILIELEKTYIKSNLIKLSIIFNKNIRKIIKIKDTKERFL